MRGLKQAIKVDSKALYADIYNIYLESDHTNFAVFIHEKFKFTRPTLDTIMELWEVKTKRIYLRLKKHLDMTKYTA